MRFDSDPQFAKVALLVVACSASSVAAQAPTRGEGRDTYAVMAELDRMAAKALWPRFDPRAYPVAIFDGTETVLFRHPSPPSEFAPVAGRPGVWRFVGRHPAVTSNSSANVGGVATATVLRGGPGTPAANRAAVAAHEIFHLFQRAQHPGWSANEATLFVYPVDDARGLVLRRVETRALSRALGASSPGERACWATAAVSARRDRFALLSADDVAYERKSELNEGLARYVQAAALGEVPDPAERDHPPDEVRDRSYATGAALAFLLDRMRPGWKAVVDGADTVAIDPLLEGALPKGVARCELDADAMQRVTENAERDVRALATRRDSLRHAFASREGWRLVVEIAREPLFPQGFDPLNVTRLTRDEVLHARFVQLGNSAGSLEVFDRPSVTTAAGAHPLLMGVRSVTVTGLSGDPVAAADSTGVSLAGEGVKGRFTGATVERDGRTVRVTLR